MTLDGKRNLYCLDWDKVKDEIEIYGLPEDENSSQRLEFVLVPCNYVHAEIQETDDYIRDECIHDKQQ